MSFNELNEIFQLRKMADRVCWTADVKLFEEYSHTFNRHCHGHFKKYGHLPMDLLQRLVFLGHKEWDGEASSVGST